MKKNKKSFKEILDALPTLKPLTKDTKLPYIFDLYYDCKTFGDLVFWKKHSKPEVRRLLAEHGFDIKSVNL